MKMGQRGNVVRGEEEAIKEMKTMIKNMKREL